MKDFSKKNYIKLINLFKKQGYFFKDYLNFKKKRCVILRHDVDFDLESAEEIAYIESKQKIKSNFFFMISNNFYNIFSKNNQRIIKNIKHLGHSISLHYDHKNYKNIKQGLNFEKKAFEKVFNSKISMISIHRPGKFLNKSIKFNLIKHTYENRYFKEIKYFSDSGGHFKYGSPITSEEFRNKKSMQLLIHPIWWVSKGKNPSEKLKNWMNSKLTFYRREISENCKTFDKRKLILK